MLYNAGALINECCVCGYGVLLCARLLKSGKKRREREQKQLNTIQHST